jgi:2-methylaconitate cis-trans-isomerase PrpF
MSFIRSWFWRGGVCNALIFRKSDLPTDRSKWQQLFAAAIGSPDPFGRQLNGMGGGISSLSKICVVSPSTRDDADVDFEFIQVVIRDGALDLASNCGNMTAAIGPFALDLNLALPNKQLLTRSGHAKVRIYNINTKKIIVSTFPITGSPPRFLAQGGYRMDGVPGSGSKIGLSFLNPGGTQTGKVLPTDHGITTMVAVDKAGIRIKASLVDVANPGVYIDGRVCGISPDILPAELDQQADLMELMETVRREAAVRMKLDPDVASVPKIVALFSPSAEEIDSGVHIKCIVLSMGQTHKAVPLTLALNLGVACLLDGTLASQLSRNIASESTVTIKHPSGTIDVGVDVSSGKVASASIYSTARLLMQGEVNVDK